jgi:hypothetical protein
MPSRVVDVTPGKSPRLVLVGKLTKAQCYTTLSHCWGISMPFCLLTCNIETVQKNIPYSSLSKTFQDAIEVTRRLHINYIWIDSLCIIQDSKQDWMQQSAKMALVYANAYCNIAAAHAAEGSSGCFSNRNPDFVRPLELTIGCDSNPGSCDAVQSTYQQNFVSRSPLGLRAWVFQERSMARRNVFFGGTEVFFQCHQLAASEAFPHTLSPSMGMTLGGIQPQLKGSYLRKSRGFKPDVALNAYSYWDWLVEDFSLGRLTYATDKLVALSAIASEMQQHLGSQYLAGLWRAHLPYQLLWEVRGVQWLAQSSRPSEYIAPSWSWASVTGRVECACDVRFLDDREIVLKVLEVHIVLASDLNPYGQVKSGYLCVQGYLARGSLVPFPKSNTGRMLFRLQSDVEVHATVILDDSKDQARSNIDELYFLPIRYLAQSEEEVFKGMTALILRLSGLILRLVCPLNDEFVRIGKFVSNQDPREFQAACDLYSTRRGDSLDHQEGGWGNTNIITIL